MGGSARGRDRETDSSRVPCLPPSQQRSVRVALKTTVSSLVPSNQTVFGSDKVQFRHLKLVDLFWPARTKSVNAISRQICRDSRSRSFAAVK